MPHLKDLFNSVTTWILGSIGLLTPSITDTLGQEALRRVIALMYQNEQGIIAKEIQLSVEAQTELQQMGVGFQVLGCVIGGLSLLALYLKEKETIHRSAQELRDYWKPRFLAAWGWVSKTTNAIKNKLCQCWQSITNH